MSTAPTATTAPITLNSLQKVTWRSWHLPRKGWGDAIGRRSARAGVRQAEGGAGFGEAFAVAPAAVVDGVAPAFMGLADAPEEGLSALPAGPLGAVRGEGLNVEAVFAATAGTGAGVLAAAGAGDAAEGAGEERELVARQGY